MREIATCVGWGPLKLHVYVISSPRTMVDGLMLRVAVHGVGGDGGEGDRVHVPTPQVHSVAQSV